MSDINKFNEFNRYTRLLHMMGYRINPVLGDESIIEISKVDKPTITFKTYEAFKAFIDGYQMRGQEMKVTIDDVKRVVKRSAELNDRDASVSIGNNAFELISISCSKSENAQMDYENLCEAIVDGINCPF